MEAIRRGRRPWVLSAAPRTQPPPLTKNKNTVGAWARHRLLAVMRACTAEAVHDRPSAAQACPSSLLLHLMHAQRGQVTHQAS
jgi:hypothetical protein